MDLSIYWNANYARKKERGIMMKKSIMSWMKIGIKGGEKDIDL
jgi:hypothetical protein